MFTIWPVIALSCNRPGSPQEPDPLAADWKLGVKRLGYMLGRGIRDLQGRPSLDLGGESFPLKYCASSFAELCAIISNSQITWEPDPENRRLRNKIIKKFNRIVIMSHCGAAGQNLCPGPQCKFNNEDPESILNADTITKEVIECI